MSTRLKILLASLGGAVLCVGLIQAWWFGYLGGGESASPDKLAEQALSAATPAEKAEAAVKLADCGPEARDELRRVLESTDLPDVQAACLQGLGALEDYDSMDLMIGFLEDESLKVRGSAGAAVSGMLLGAGAKGVEFKADGSEEERQQAVKMFRTEWEKLRGSPLLIQYLNESQEGRENEN